LEDLIVALKIVTPNSKSTDENKENIQQSSMELAAASKSERSEPMDVSESSATGETAKGESSSAPNDNAEMISDCSISEND